jgi:hypothetical protein
MGKFDKSIGLLQDKYGYNREHIQAEYEKRTK